jgi:replication factor C small subunit
MYINLSASNIFTCFGVVMDVALPWTEKYRPKKLEEVVGHGEIVKRLNAYAREKNMPSLLFSGRAGIGKTVCALALANELFDDTMRQNFLELNASDERGIDIVRNKVKDFAAILPYSGANFKIIFLDEADALTSDAQNALRRTMETYAHTTRFVLSANYSSKIIEPIQSRCAMFRFRPLSEGDINKRLKHIAGKEKLKISDDGYKALVYASEGDLRRAINFLQTAASIGEEITEDAVYKTASRARPKQIQELLQEGLKGNFDAARKKLDELLFEYGMSGEDVLLQVYREVIDSDMDQWRKVELIDRIGEYNFRLTEGANDRLQLESLIAYLVLLGSRKK